MANPEIEKDVQSFLGLINYYRRFIKNCSKVSKPLTELTKEVPFVWNERSAEAFKVLKEMVTTAPILQAFREDLPVIVTTDASKKAIGAVLEQDGPDRRRTVASLLAQ